MKNFINKHKIVVVICIILVLLVLNLYLYKDSKNLIQIKSDLELKNYGLSLDLKKSEVKERKLLKEIEEKENLIKGLEKSKSDSMEKYYRLKQEFSHFDSGVSPKLSSGDWIDLKDCQNKISHLYNQLNLCNSLENEAEKSLNFCREKNIKLNNIVEMQETIYLECQEQVRLKDLKINQTEAAMERLDRFYKRKLLKRDTVKYTIGIIAGILVGYFLLKKKK